MEENIGYLDIPPNTTIECPLLAESRHINKNMNKKLSNTPFSIISLIAIIVSTFVVDQLSSFYDEHWEIAEFTFDDPTYLGMSTLWLAVVLWISFDTLKGKKHIPTTLKIITAIFAVFFIFELIVNDITLSLLLSFQALEIALWITAFILSINYKTWFVE